MFVVYVRMRCLYQSLLMIVMVKEGRHGLVTIPDVP